MDNNMPVKIVLNNLRKKLIKEIDMYIDMVLSFTDGFYDGLKASKEQQNIQNINLCFFDEE